MNRKFGLLLILLGLLLALAALGLTGYNLWDDHRAGAEAEKVTEAIQHHRETFESVSRPSARPSDSSADSDPVSGEEPVKELPVLEIDGNRYIGTISIPALELELPVLENWSLALLKLAPCRYMGTPYQGNFILCAHNYSTHFGRLDDLQPGDTVVFTDVEGTAFFYTVAETDLLPGSAVEEMEIGGWDLSLFTCTTNGQTRVTVRCRSSEENVES